MSELVGPYEIREVLGKGSFGELLLGVDASGSRVVVKRLKIDLVVDDKALELFRRETGILRSLRHSAVPRFIDSGVDEAGLPYLVQEYIPGPTLEQAVRDGLRFDSGQARRLAVSLLEALEYLHGLHPPVIHRDIKPANIILDGERPVIVDFGAVVGKALLEGETTDTVVGTFGYMAPEMLKGKTSPASDLYSLGATLLFAFSGRQPESFPTERLRLKFRAALALPDDLADLIQALVEPAVEDRPASAEEALALLKPPSTTGLPATAKHTRQLPAKRQKRRRALQVIGLGSLAATGIAALVYGPAVVFGVIKSAAIGVLVVVLVVLVVLTLGGGC